MEMESISYPVKEPLLSEVEAGVIDNEINESVSKLYRKGDCSIAVLRLILHGPEVLSKDPKWELKGTSGEILRGIS